MNSVFTARKMPGKRVPGPQQAGRSGIRALGALGVALAAAFSIQTAGGQSIQVPKVPLMVGGGQPANVMFLFDNSIGMASFQLPTNVPEFGQHTGTSYRRQHYQNLAARSVHLNKLAYDPEKTYLGPRKQDDCSSGTCVVVRYPDVPFTAAPLDGFGAGHPDPTMTVDLSRLYQDRTFGGLTVTSRSQPDENGKCTMGTGHVSYLGDDKCSNDLRDARPRSAYYTYFRADREGPYATGTPAVESTTTETHGNIETYKITFSRPTGVAGSQTNVVKNISVAGIDVQLGPRTSLPLTHPCKVSVAGNTNPTDTNTNTSVAERVECVLRNTPSILSHWEVSQSGTSVTLKSKVEDNVPDPPAFSAGELGTVLFGTIEHADGNPYSSVTTPYTPATKGCVYRVYKQGDTTKIYNIVDLDPRKGDRNYKPSWCLTNATAAECVSAGNRAGEGWWSIAQLVGNTGSSTSNAATSADSADTGSINTGDDTFSGYKVTGTGGAAHFRTPFQACFEVVKVGSARDQELTGKSEAAAKQNFANWYSYYSSRVNLLKSTVSEVLNDLDGDYRIGFGVTGAQGSEGHETNCDGTPSAGVAADCRNGRAFPSQSDNTIIYRAGLTQQTVDGLGSGVAAAGFYGIARGVRPFQDFAAGDTSVPSAYRGKKFKSQVFDFLFSLSTASVADTDMRKSDSGDKVTHAASGRTGNLANLRRAVGEAGEYFRLNDMKGPWSLYPGLTVEQGTPAAGDTFKKQKIQACRKSYLVLVTAGAYSKDNDDLPVNTCARGDQDGVSGQSFLLMVHADLPAAANNQCFGYLANSASSYSNDNKVLSAGGGPGGEDVTMGSYRLSMAPRGARGEFYPYFPQLPFADRKDGSNYAGYKNTLADVAMAYWKSDLLIGAEDNSDVYANNVPISAEDYAYWQHMNTVILQMGDSSSVRAEGDSGIGSYSPVVQSVLRGEEWLLASEPKWGYSDTAGSSVCSATTANQTGDGTGGTEWCDPASDAEVLGVPRSRMYGNDLLHAAINGRGGYHSVESPDSLTKAIKKAMDAMKDSGLSFTKVETNSGSRKTPLLYYASFSSNNWYGDLDAFRICSGADVYRDWDAATRIFKTTTVNQRSKCTQEGDPWVIPDWRVSSKDEFGVEGILNSQGLTNRNVYVGTAPTGSLVKLESTAAIPGLSAELIDYLLGSAANEQQNGGTFRDRDTADLAVVCGTDADPEPCTEANKNTAHQPPAARHLLGDIVNSSPVFVGNDDFGFASAGSLTAAQRSAYVTRKTSATSGNLNRRELLWVGANDGMLHAFDASPNSTADGSRDSADAGGKEVFAFIPSYALPRLGELADPNYTHEFYVDGEISVGDAILASDSKWHTVLVGSSGAGGGAYYALDIENPAALGVSSRLWEVSNATTGYGKLGTLAVGKASIAQVGIASAAGAAPTGQWASIFGNGYNSTGNHAALFVVNLNTGEPLAVLDVLPTDPPSQPPNGLGSPLVVDFEGDGLADVAYAGDLNGNLWRFSLNPLEASGILKGTRIFSAAISGTPQPIMGQPEAAVIRGKVMVYFGTGKYLEAKDRGTSAIQTFYGIQDPCGRAAVCPASTAPVTRSGLLEQKIAAEVTKRVCLTGGTACTNPVVSDARVVSANQFNEAGTLNAAALATKGFYLDLVNMTTSEATRVYGERVISKPVVWDDRVMFTSIIPGDDGCTVDGDGWLYELDPQWGSRLKFSVFDLDRDGTFGDGNDLVGDLPASGRRVGMGGGLTARGNSKYVGGKDGIQSIANNPEHSPYIGRKIGPLEFR